MSRERHLLVLGLSHKTAPVDVRERFAIPEGALPETASRVRAVDGCRETFLVSTCNRVELYAACDDVEVTGSHLVDWMAEVGGASRRRIEPHLYRHTGRGALLHLFRVAASLDSMVVGEPQILGQLKTAFETCRGAGLTGPDLNVAVERAFAVAKRVRTETGIGRSSVSISSVAVDLARQIFGDLGKCTALLVGAGKMGEIAARHICAAGTNELLVANRSFDRARELAEKLGGHPRGLDEFDALLVQADIVVTSTAAPSYLVDRKRMKKALRARKYRPLFFIDIAVPRNVDPAINDLDNVFVYDVDDLSGIAGENLAGRQREADAAEEMVIAEAERFLRELAARAATPTIVALRQQAAAITHGEFARARGKLGDLDEKQLKSVSRMADGIANKLLHPILIELKRAAAEPDGDQIVSVVRRLFRIESDES